MTTAVQDPGTSQRRRDDLFLRADGTAGVVSHRSTNAEGHPPNTVPAMRQVVAEGADIAAGRFTPQAGGALDGARILRPETVALMGQNQIGEIDVGILKTTVPALSNDVDLCPGVTRKWGFGHMITMQAVAGGRGVVGQISPGHGVSLWQDAGASSARIAAFDNDIRAGELS